MHSNGHHTHNHVIFAMFVFLLTYFQLQNIQQDESLDLQMWMNIRLFICLEQNYYFVKGHNVLNEYFDSQQNILTLSIPHIQYH